MNIEMDISPALRLTTTVLKQIPFATAKALTKTAQQAKLDIVANMKTVFDRPTPYTLNSLYIKPATKTDLESEVFIKNDSTTGTPASKYLAPEVYGGGRNMKRGEKALINKGLLPSGSYLVPGQGLKLNQYGNITSGMMIKILSGVSATTDRYQYQTKRSIKRQGANAGSYFVVSEPGGRLPLGVYQRLSEGHVAPLLIAISAPHYRERLSFFKLARETYQRVFNATFNKALADAIATAR